MANEKRLIDANALMENKTNLWDEALGYSDCVLVEDIENAPTVDAVEVVRGEWDTVFYERNGTLASYSHLCPRCKYFYRDLRFKGHNYCPNCGAKMDGEEKDSNLLFADTEEIIDA